MTQSNLPADGADRASSLATKHADVTLNRIMLLGVAGPAEAPRALVRLPDGSTHKVTEGDTLDGGQVRGIAENQLSLIRNGRERILRLP